MNPYLDEKHERFRAEIREFAEAEIGPIARELDEKGEFPWESVRKMAELGLFGVNVPTEYGGQGLDYLSYLIVIEELARVDASHAITVSAHSTLGTSPILNFGTEAQKRRYVPLLATGRVLGGFGLTEPGAGSDAGGVTTTAIPDGDYFVLNGRKTFISGAPMADYCIIFARTDLTQKGSRGISAFIVDMKLPGVSLGKDEDKMGIRGYPTCDVILEDVRVHKSDLLGELNRGFQNAMKTLDGGRLGVAAQSCGIGQACLDEAVKYAKERKQFGRRIADFQGISFMIADMAAELAAAKELTYNAAVLKDMNSKDAPVACSIAKYYASEMCNRLAYKAVQIHGGYGYIKDYRVERLYRDARIMTIYEGTSQVQQMVISASLLK